MKLAFSTLACPDFTWPDIYSMAKDIGFDGIEIRGLGKDIFAVKAPPFTDAPVSYTHLITQFCRGCNGFFRFWRISQQSYSCHFIFLRPSFQRCRLFPKAVITCFLL